MVKNIDYDYKFIENLSNKEQEKYMQLAKESGMMQFPLIIKDDKIIDLKDV